MNTATATPERSLRYVSTKGMSREEWIDARKTLGVGSSEIGAILGLIPEYRTALSVYKEKIGEGKEIEQTERMEFGLKLEKVAADTYEERSGRTVQRDNKIRIHKRLPYMIANIDRLILARGASDLLHDDLTSTTGILEIKTTSSYAFKSWKSQLPLEYYAQLQHQFAVTGFTWGVFAIIVDGSHYEQIEVLRDDAYIATLEAAVEDFWINHVEKRIPPPLVVQDFEVATTDPNAKIEATDEILDLLERLSIVNETMKTLADTKTAAENRIKLFIGERELLVRNGEKLASWKRSKETVALDVDRLREELPDIAKKYEVTKAGSRRFIITKQTKQLEAA